MYSKVKDLIPEQLSSLELIEVDAKYNSLSIFLGQADDVAIFICFNVVTKQSVLIYIKDYSLTAEEVVALGIFMQNIERTL